MKPAIENTQPRPVISVLLMNEASISGIPIAFISGVSTDGIALPIPISGAATMNEPIIPRRTIPIEMSFPQRFEIVARSNFVSISDVFFVFVTVSESRPSIHSNLQSLV